MSAVGHEEEGRGMPDESKPGIFTPGRRCGGEGQAGKHGVGARTRAAIVNLERHDPRGVQMVTAIFVMANEEPQAITMAARISQSSGWDFCVIRLA